MENMETSKSCYTYSQYWKKQGGDKKRPCSGVNFKSAAIRELISSAGTMDYQNDKNLAILL